MPFGCVNLPIKEVIDFEAGELRAVRLEMPDGIEMRHRRPGNAFWARLWGGFTQKLEVRAYSFSDSTLSGVIETVVSKSPQDPNTSLYLQGVTVGTPVEIRLETGGKKLFINPRKDLELEPDDWWPNKKFLFIGLGTGVTPHLSVVRYMAALGMQADVVYVASAKTSKRLIFHDELKWNAKHWGGRFTYMPFLTRVAPGEQPPDWQYYLGRPTLRTLSKFIPYISERHVRICGVGGAKDIFGKEAQELGVKFASVKSEEW